MDVLVASTQLNFDGSKTLARRYSVTVSEHSKYIHQVNSVIRTYNLPMVQEFRIRFNMDYQHKEVIDEWLQFAVNKKVEFLELDFKETSHMTRSHSRNYELPLRLSYENIANRPSSDTTVKELAFLKKLILKNVNVRGAILREFITNSPHLETILIHGSGYLKHIHVDGRALNLKHFEIVCCFSVKSIYLSDFDLVSFTYDGPPIDLRLTRLPKLKELDLGQVFCLENNVFGKIWSCTSSLDSLSFRMYSPKKDLKIDSIPRLPNVKRLILTIGAHKDDYLLEFALIADACPNLESFTVELPWYSPIRRRREARNVATHHHRPREHLKLLKILGYFGRISDFELAAVRMERISGSEQCHHFLEYNRELGTKQMSRFGLIKGTKKIISLFKSY